MYRDRWQRRLKTIPRVEATYPTPLGKRQRVVQADLPRKKTVTPLSLLGDQSVFQLGGMGTYILSGPTNSGKNHWLEKQLQRAAADMDPETVFVFSTTGELNNDWDFLEETFPNANIHHHNDFSQVHGILKRIEDPLKLEKRKGGDLVQWKKDHTTLFLINDFFGMGNLSSPTSVFSTMASKIRHLGGYLVLFTQHVTKLNPGIYGNSRAVISFDAAHRAWDVLRKNCPMDISIQLAKKNNSRLYHFTLLMLATRDARCMALTQQAIYCKPLASDGRITVSELT